ncbi:plasminogen receptor (KT)-like [Pectinophora gossypiella]|uniref:Plasminogen receptor (KT) n=1 Tax=Pectinophora gossypiella TaxID=13191 RepID=A0A1E1WFI9_PECGO|nr:plasminogen receptor (KT)-like [Pectinophora gossypiella]XP_049880419.1 plasminogen receptor (KT)-like [Pectinophora gossypiella]
MGNYFTVNMEENFKKNQEFIQTINKIKMERQIQLQYQMQERQVAMQIAKNRDTCLWLTAFYIASATGLFTGFRRTKRQYLLMPLIPLTFVTLYYWDLAYGNKIHRIRMEAEHIMTHEADSLEWPCGLPTPSSIDLGRLEVEEKKKIHPPLL